MTGHKKKRLVNSEKDCVLCQCDIWKMMYCDQVPGELEQQKALLQQVLSLTPEQINSLPPDQRQQVLQLQQALRT
jgi:hypothetical protein